MGKTLNLLLRKKVSRTLKVVLLLAYKVRIIDSIGHYSRVSYHAPYPGYKFHPDKKKRIGQDASRHVCSNNFYFTFTLKFIFCCYRPYINIYINFHIDSKICKLFCISTVSRSLVWKDPFDHMKRGNSINKNDFKLGLEKLVIINALVLYN